MLKITRWYPDTCDCVIDVTWESSLSPSRRVHTYLTTVASDSAHAHVAGTPLHLTVVAEENGRKRFAPDVIRSRRSGFSDADYVWSFNAQRQLVVSLPGALALERQSIQQDMNTRFGAGKVVVTDAAIVADRR